MLWYDIGRGTGRGHRQVARVGADVAIRRVVVLFADGLQLDLATIAEIEVRRGDAAPDFVPLYRQEDPPALSRGPSADDASADQVREWAFLGWRALLDADEYLRRGSRWEAHSAHLPAGIAQLTRRTLGIDRPRRIDVHPEKDTSWSRSVDETHR